MRPAKYIGARAGISKGGRCISNRLLRQTAGPRNRPPLSVTTGHQLWFRDTAVRRARAGPITLGGVTLRGLR